MTGAEVANEQKKRRRFSALVYLFGVLIAISLCGGGLAIYDRFSQTNARRTQQSTLNKRFEAQNRKQLQAWHIVFCDAEKLVRESKDITPAARDNAIAFYDKELRQLGADPCPKGGK